MKSKRFQKKLVLKKRTIADLNTGEMRFAVGGGFTDAVTCIACATEECPQNETQWESCEPDCSLVCSYGGYC